MYLRTGREFPGKVHAGDDVRYGNEMAEIIDPYDGTVREKILAPTDGIVFSPTRRP